MKGSTKALPQRIRLQGVLSSSSEVNPHLHDANAVYIHYCDGGMFAGARDDPVLVKTAKDKDAQAEPANVRKKYAFCFNTERSLQCCTSGLISSNACPDHIVACREAGKVNGGGQKNAAPEKRVIHMRGYFILKAVMQHLTTSTDILRTAQNILFVGLQGTVFAVIKSNPLVGCVVDWDLFLRVQLQTLFYS